MYQSPLIAIGLMSGTSLDGLDLCCAAFTLSNQKWTFKILESKTTDYSFAWRDKLKHAHKLSPIQLRELDVEFGHYLGNEAIKFIEENRLKKVDLIASHGHTIFHEPDKKSTFQLGNGPEIFTRTKIKTICDFRLQDVLLGGQGAPLVPIGDELLFGQFDACINLGGFANISYKANNKRVAFDICPVNIVLNHICNRLELPYDEGGKIAASGNILKPLLTTLNNLEFYHLKAPKSLGREWVEQNIIPILSIEEKPQDILRTFTTHAAQTIVQALPKNTHNILFTGGGAYNTYLLEQISIYSQAKITVPPHDLINQKEALIFAFLGVLRSLNKVNCLQSVTGAKSDHSSGRIYN